MHQPFSVTNIYLLHLFIHLWPILTNPFCWMFSTKAIKMEFFRFFYSHQMFWHELSNLLWNSKFQNAQYNWFINKYLTKKSQINSGENRFCLLMQHIVCNKFLFVKGIPRNFYRDISADALSRTVECWWSKELIVLRWGGKSIKSYHDSSLLQSFSQQLRNLVPNKSQISR